MNDLRARLEASLSAAYRLERELGSGGMAVVYLAHDLRNKRRVALKVLRPEVSAVIGPERFLREIETLANLTHPHILPLHDSGVADGLLYYVMPYIEGESLRDRLLREKQLPLDDALRITREVADALSHAHARGVIHRDIKPENILLSGSHALVADFGIAAAIDVAGGSRLTETGIAVGTPAYMSPEQALGERAIDARADIYALGCVLYEMLAGEPPFTGPTAQVVLARKLHEPVKSLRKTRELVPEPIDQAITQALARSPADRFATAGRFVEALGRSERVEPVRKLASILATRRMRYSLAALALVAAAITLFIVIRPVAPLDDKLLLVLPFRLVTDDSTLASHRQGSMELLTTKINATEVLRAVDPVQTIRALGSRRNRSEIGLADARQLARQHGAGSVITGKIVVAQGRATVTVTASEVANERDRSTTATGPAVSLISLMDEIALKALLLAVGEREDRVHPLPTTSFPALKAYLAGVVAPTLAAGERHFDDALRYDSTFALVALRLWTGATSTANFGPAPKANRLAFKALHKLSERDQAFLLADVGPRYPEESWVSERLTGIESKLGPSERGELWLLKADWLFHQGAVIGMDKPLEAARRAFDRAGGMRLCCFDHQIQTAAMLGDTAALDTLVERALAENILPNAHMFFRWLRAAVMDDRPALDSLRAAFPSAHSQSLGFIVSVSQELGIHVPDGRIALQLLGDRASTQREQGDYRVAYIGFASNLGRPAEAARASQTGTLGQVAIQRIWGALYKDMDTIGIGPSISRLQARTHPDTTEARRIEPLCVLETWRLEHGDYRSAESTVQQLRRARSGARIDRELCPLIIEALVEVRDQRSTRALVALDSLARLGPLGPVHLRQVANLILMRLHERRGDLQRALAAARRRGNLASEGNYLSTFLREEGRLAALVGDTSGAIRAYQHYLNLRYDPEPVLRAEVDSIRAELSRLTRDRPENARLK